MIDDAEINIREGLWHAFRPGGDGLLTGLRLDWNPVFGDRLELNRLELMILRAKLQYALDEVNRQLRDGRAGL
jgi:hypothetical protein